MSRLRLISVTRFLLLAFLLALPLAVMADSSVVHPTTDADVSGTWTLTGCSTNRVNCVGETSPSDTEYITLTTTGGGYSLFTGTISIPSGASAITVVVNYRDQKAGSPAAAVDGRLKVNGTVYAIDSHNPSNGTWAARTATWSTNPNTSAAWTAADINGTGPNPLQQFGVGSTDSSPNISVSYVDITITYSTGPAFQPRRSTGVF
jgi:outer membrane autotransporter protein